MVKYIGAYCRVAHCEDMKLTVEKLWFPCLVVVLQVLFLTIFGTLVEYDVTSSPLANQSDSSLPNSDGEIHQYYPR